ncbi:MAG: hypothetical protein ACW972_05635 [Promethearchaeota archaeon]
MKDILTKKKFFIFLVIIAYSLTLTIFLLTPKRLNSDGFNFGAENANIPYNIKPANDDNNAPIITFVKPDSNDTSIVIAFYDFIVNVTDDNPPSPGNVTIEISNASTSFFNASMLFFQGIQWFFSWENSTSYPNEKTYIIRVRAIDSSSNANAGLSADLSVFLDIREGGGLSILNFVIYIIAVVFIFALIMLYFNKKRVFLKKFKDES